MSKKSAADEVRRCFSASTAIGSKENLCQLTEVSVGEDAAEELRERIEREESILKDLKERQDMSKSGRGGDVEITKIKQKQGAKRSHPNLEIRAGVGAGTAPGGDIFFTTGDGKEAFRIKGDGTVMINGERCAHDKELYEAMRDFFYGTKGSTRE